MNFINKTLRKAGVVAGLSALLVSANACDPFHIIEPSVENPRVVMINGPHEVSPGANYSIEVVAEQGNLTPVIQIRRGGDPTITKQGYSLRADFVAAPVPGEEILNISAFSVVNGARHDTTYSVIRR